MNPNERDRILFRLSSAWPRPPWSVETMAVWSEHLAPLAFDVAWSAVLTLERNRSRQPAIADFHEAYGACRPQASTAPAPIEEEWGMTKEQAKANLRTLRTKLEQHRPKW